MIRLDYANNKSVRVSSGQNSFGIAFCEVPRASDNAKRSFQRVHTPLTDHDGSGSKGSSLHSFPFTIYSGRTRRRNATEVGSHYLAIEDDKAFAIRIFSGPQPDIESAFKVKVRIGGVNVLQHTTTDGKPNQDYFVISEQKWVWGKQVDETTARQFRVFGHARESLSARAQLKGDNLVKEVEIEITPREQRPRTPATSPHYCRWSRSPTADESPSRRSRSGSPATLVQSDTDADISVLSAGGSIGPSPSTRPTTRQGHGSASTLDERTVVSFSSSSSSPGAASSQGFSCHLQGDLESILSDPEPEASTNPPQMVIGTGGLIRQIVEKDQHPDWVDSPDRTIILKFNIFDPEFFEEATDIPLGNPGGNYEEKVPNPPHRCFKPVPPVVQDPDGLRKDLLSPMELEGVDGADEMNAFLSLLGEARSQPRKEQPPWPPTAGLMMERPPDQIEQPEEEKKSGPEPEPEPEPIPRQPNPFLVPVPVSKPEKQERNNSNNNNTMDSPRPRDMLRSSPSTGTGRCTTDLTGKESSTKRWKSKWRKLITAMRRLLSPGF